jgi:hypothetical protein
MAIFTMCMQSILGVMIQVSRRSYYYSTHQPPHLISSYYLYIYLTMVPLINIQYWICALCL